MEGGGDYANGRFSWVDLRIGKQVSTVIACPSSCWLTTVIYKCSYAICAQAGQILKHLLLIRYFFFLNFSYGTPLGDDAVTRGTQLDALAIRPNSSNNHKL